MSPESKIQIQFLPGFWRSNFTKFHKKDLTKKILIFFFIAKHDMRDLGVLSGVLMVLTLREAEIAITDFESPNPW